MLIDLQTTFSGATAVDGTKTGQALTSTAISANVLDLRNAATPATADEGLTPGQDFWLVVQVLQTFTTGTSATLTATLESDSAVGLGSAPVVHSTLCTAVAAATLVAGYTIARIQLPAADYKRYLGLRYTVNVGTFTAGSVLAFLTPDIYRVPQYPIGFSVA